MKLSKKDIKKEFFEDKTKQGEIAPILFKKGKIYIPTMDGLKPYTKGEKNGRNK